MSITGWKSPIEPYLLESASSLCSKSVCHRFSSQFTIFVWCHTVVATQYQVQSTAAMCGLHCRNSFSGCIPHVPSFIPHVWVHSLSNADRRAIPYPRYAAVYPDPTSKSARLYLHTYCPRFFPHVCRLLFDPYIPMHISWLLITSIVSSVPNCSTQHQSHTFVIICDAYETVASLLIIGAVQVYPLSGPDLLVSVVPKRTLRCSPMLSDWEDGGIYGCHPLLCSFSY